MDEQKKMDLRRKLLGMIGWANEDSIKGELTDEEMELRFMSLMKMNDCLVAGNYHGSLIRHACPLAYRGVHFRLVISQKYAPNESEGGEMELHPRKGIGIECHLGDGTPGFDLIRNGSCLGNRKFLADGEFDSTDDQSLKNRVEKRLLRTADEIDWLLDEAGNDIRRHCEGLLETLAEATEDIEDEEEEGNV